MIYGASTVLGRFLNFLLVPFYVNVLRSSADYGVATSLYTYIGFFNVIYTLGLEAAYFRYGARGEGEPFDADRERRMFSTPFWIVAATSALFSLALAGLAPVLVGPVFHDPTVDIRPFAPALASILRLAAAILLFDNLATLPFAALRLEHQALRFGLIRLFGIVVTLALNFLFVLRWKWGVEGIFRANLIASVGVLILLLPTIRTRLAWRWDRDVARTFLPFGLTNVPAYLGSMMVQVIDRPIVQSFLGLAALGVYQANYRMGFVMMVFVGLFEYAWRPFFMRQALKDDAAARRLFARVFTLFTGVCLLAFLALAWGLPALVSTPIFGRRLLTEAYDAGRSIIPVILLAYVFQGMYTNFLAGIYIKERNRALPWVTGLGASVNVAANFLLIPRWGMMGAAVATLLAYAVMAARLYVEARRVYPVPYDWGRVGGLSAAVAAALLADKILRVAVPSLAPVTVGLVRGGLTAAVTLGAVRLGYFKEPS
jgi:O-antigen/teichoic acid export membrane protein